MEEREAVLDVTPEAEPIQKANFKIYNYMKGHTGFLATCVSAVVAVLSFAINYANHRHDIAYLEYWSIEGIYTTVYRTNFYALLWSFLCCVAMLIIHALLSGTSDEFRYYNRFLSVIKWDHKTLTKAKKDLRIIERKHRKALRARKTTEESTGLDQLGQEIRHLKEAVSSEIKNTREAESARKICSKWIRRNILLSVVVSYLVGVVVSMLSVKSISFKSFAEASILTLSVILFDMLIYFLPAYLSTRCTKKAIQKWDLDQLEQDCSKLEAHGFPLEKLADHRLAVSDSKIKLILAQLVVSMVLFIFMISMSGTKAAQNKRQFQIYEDDRGVYAVVYHTGDAFIMEEAHIADGDITIDPAKQRILASEDFSYQLVTFEHVYRKAIP